jgi:phenylalanyl-tRNA synthetase beta chain
MKLSESWLREWVNPTLTREQLGEKLTMAGLEIDELAPIVETLFDDSDTLKASTANDYSMDIAITPNRGDCLSVLGMAKEIAALTECQLHMPDLQEVASTITDVLPIAIQAPLACPRYVGRVIRDVKANAVTPLYIRERLRINGTRSISAIVDVMNYVMIELGQPMHAFSLDKIVGGIQVRHAHVGEVLPLLDETSATLDAETVVIADHEKALAIAGIMGGLESGVTLQTQDIFLESAYFAAATTGSTARRLGIGSDSSYRFERGVDPALQRIAIERATQLILTITGGKPGPVIEINDQAHLPQVATITLRAKRIAKILGYAVSNTEVEMIMQRLGFTCQLSAAADDTVWLVTVPARRSDVTIEIDLIEEIARLSGYDKFPTRHPIAGLQINPVAENKVSLQSFRRLLVDLGYQEVITYSFVESKLQELFSPNQPAKDLLNPMTAEMATMRTSLWPGLFNTFLYNQNRQQSRIRLFETGLRFIQQSDSLLQEAVLSGLICGSALPEQWGVPARSVDFFDIKGDLEKLFKLTLAANEFSFRAESYPALHPGQTAVIYRQDVRIGVVGAIHPTIAQTLKIEGKVYLFEILLNSLEVAAIPHYKSLSKFPEIRRDLAILVDQTVPTQAIQDTIRNVAGDWLIDINIFDVYQGKGIEPGQKSVALALTLQHTSRTLIDQEVTDLTERVIIALKGKFNAELRG